MKELTVSLEKALEQEKVLLCYFSVCIHTCVCMINIVTMHEKISMIPSENIYIECSCSNLYVTKDQVSYVETEK